MPDKKDEYILFSSNYSSQFVDTPLWLGPALMKPTQPLPPPPKDQETVAFFFTQVNMTADGGSMHSKQCWVRSATSYHNLTVDSQGFVMNGSSVTTPKINSNAPAGDQYRLNKFDSTSIAILFAALLYWGWWQLGRHVSFSPIEIAKAFDAPLLQDVNTNSRAKDLLRDVGNLRIRYGAVSQRQPLLGERKQDTTPSTLGEPRDRLVFGLADQTLRPYGGQVFSK
jgi:hypothetical protein